jgi:hypothetical protein
MEEFLPVLVLLVAHTASKARATTPCGTAEAPAVPLKTAGDGAINVSSFGTAALAIVGIVQLADTTMIKVPETIGCVIMTQELLDSLVGDGAINAKFFSIMAEVNLVFAVRAVVMIPVALATILFNTFQCRDINTFDGQPFSYFSKQHRGASLFPCRADPLPHQRSDSEQLPI